ncbi:hypothetical protein [Peredibacter starrii]|uniref:Tail fiber protein n=1 Tax=Peredibacter starrii TaxID=28202 RepID=A0AAX4HP58_9BACT|nr:hypothetical protein [Peredibacter starrii]WPU64936.1 hypothetical protein SOO65_19765 [Peredibacter starrii]
MINIGCQPAGIPLGGEIQVSIRNTKPSISKVIVQNDQLIISGKNLDSVTIAKITGSTNHTFEIESKSDNKLVLNAKSALSLLVGGTFDLLIGNAKADATFPISFELQNGQVTAAKLHSMGASSGQFLRFNGTNWAPASISSSQVFAGAYDAANDSPDIVAAGGSSGTYYVVSVAGTQDLGSGLVSFNVGDWVIYNGAVWEKLAVGSNTVSSFNGRTGLVVPTTGDYTWSMLTKAAGKLTGSKVSDIADVDVAGIQDGDILQWNAGGSKWEVNSVPTPTITAGSITNTQLANSAVDSNKIVDGTIVNADISATAAIDQSKINGLTTALNGKEASLPTGGTTAHYLRGDKTWVNFATTVLGTQLAGYTAGTAIPLTSADTIPQAIGKLDAYISAVTAAQGNYVLRSGASAMTGDLQMGGNQITGLGAPGADTDAATKKYVDDAVAGVSVGGGSQWTTNGTAIHYNTGRVGVGTATPSTLLEVSTGATPPAADVNVISMAIQSNVDDISGSGATFDNGLKQYQIGVADDEVPGIGGVRPDGIGTAMSFKMTPLTDGTDPFTSYVFRGPATASDLWIHNGRIFNSGISIGYDRLSNPIPTNGAIINGNVGIGVAAPGQKLSVAGTVGLKSTTANYVTLSAPAGLASTYALTFPADDGTANQVLTTDGSGTLTWTTPATGGAPTGSAGGDLTGTYPNPTIAAGLAASKIAGGTVDDTEFGYLNGVTSNIQTQLTAATLPSGGTTGNYLRGDKTWQSLSTDVMASVMLTFSAVTGSSVISGDSVLGALQKLQGQIDTHTTTLSSHGTSITANTTWTKTGTTDVKYVGGNVGIARDPASNTKLDVEGQIRSGSSSITTNAINFAAGNTVTTTHDCGTAMTLANIRDGGSYTVVVTGASTTQCSFSTTTTGDDANTVTYRFQPANGVRTASSHTIYSMLRVGTIIYVSWISGFL